mgnify:CR=1 FL=1
MDMLKQNLPTLSECLDKMDGNADLHLTQLVAGLQQYWNTNYPQDQDNVQSGLADLQKILSCIFYGDPNAKLDFDESCEFGSIGCQGGNMDSLFDNFDRHIDDVGWSLVGVDGGEEGLTFSYTVGLSVTYPEMPEIMCLGLHPQQAGGVIDLLIQHWKDNGFCMGNLSGIIKNDLDIKLSFVDILGESEAMFECFPRFAFEYRDRAGLDAEATEFVQLVWPTPEGLFVESQVQPFLPTKPYLKEV